MKKKLNPWTENPSYVKWVKSRDKALEDLHTRAQVESSDIMRKLLTDVLLMAKAYYTQLKSGHPQSIDQFESHVKNIFSAGVSQLYGIIIMLKIRSYVLSKSSETEIIAQLTDEQVVSKIRSEEIYQIAGQDSTAGGEMIQRMTLYMDKLRRRIVSMAQGSAINAGDEMDFLQDILAAFPKDRVVKRPKRILKPLLRESDKKPKFDIAIDNIDENTWNDMLRTYMDEYVPKWRAPPAVVDLPIVDPTIQADGTEVWYAWEFERDMTNEFVQSVRDGQIAAANENGITDFVVISIIDDRTCEHCCGDFGCVDFDGLLVSEIEKMTGGEQSAPPYHFNCRCTLAPATDNIPKKPDNGGNEFDDWLLN